MKRICLFFLFCAVSSTVFAAPCYGTKLPKKNKIFIGSQSYTIVEKELESDFGDIRSRQEFFQLSYGLTDWLSLDLKIGTGNIKQHPLGSDEVDYSSSFAGGYGYRIKLIDFKNCRTVFGFQHVSVHPYSSEIGEVRNKAILDDWQYSLLASYKINCLMPYLGLRWARVDYIHRQDSERKRKMSILSKSIGLVSGLDFSVNDKMWVNIEGQFIDGKALSLSFNYAF